MISGNFDYNTKYSPLWIIIPYYGKGTGYGRANMTGHL
jgi:hypothetical protein